MGAGRTSFNFKFCVESCRVVWQGCKFLPKDSHKKKIRFISVLLLMAQYFYFHDSWVACIVVIFTGALFTGLKWSLVSSACSNYNSPFKFSFGVWVTAISNQIYQCCLQYYRLLISFFTFFFFTRTCLLHSYVPTFASCNHLFMLQVLFCFSISMQEVFPRMCYLLTLY